ncbi:acyl-CoA dehydrogenase [Streptomyces sp. NPDC002667]|uniref:acyl-CoA dehydrogenase family protein n=1 Tax=Streptomyces sp. NPDC002667 TaxID=3364657 RepID=UPI0036CE9D1F
MALATSQPTVQDGPAGPAAHQPPHPQPPDRLDADRQRELRAIETRTLEKISTPAPQDPAPAQDLTPAQDPGPTPDLAPAQDLAPVAGHSPVQGPSAAQDSPLVRDLTPAQGPAPADDPARAEGPSPVRCPAPAQDLAPAQAIAPVQGPAQAQDPALVRNPAPAQDSPLVQDLAPAEGSSPAEYRTPAQDLAPVQGTAPAQAPSPVQDPDPTPDPTPAQDLTPTPDPAPAPAPAPAEGLTPAQDPAPAEGLTPARELSPAEDLARLLFGEDQERERVHGPWRRLIQDETFRHHPGRTPAQQAAQAYDWLRMVNDTLEDPQALATDPAQLAALHEWTAIVDGGGSLCTVASIHYNLFLGSLLDHQKAGHRDLTPYTSLQRIGTFLCTEVEHGNDSAALETTATHDPAGGGFILNTPHPGAQKFMPNTSLTGGPKTAVVAARLIIDGHDEGVYLFLTPLSDETGLLPGIRVRPLPMRPTAPVDHCLTAFDHVPLPRTALLESDHGHLTDDGTLTSSLGNRRKRFLRSIARVTTGKLCMSAAAIGAARAALTIAVQYGEHRHVSGPRPGERITVNTHRTHHAPLLNSIATAYAMTLLHRTALHAWTHHTPETRDQAERLTAITKAWNTWQARTITTQARERCGAQGLFAVNHLAGFPDYIEGTITAEGDNLVIWAKAAAELLLTPTTPPPTPPTTTGPADLTNPHHIHTLLTHAENIWHTRARTALRNAPPKNPAGRWNHASTPALEMLTLHTTNHAATALLNATHNTHNPHTQTLLTHLTHLFLLQQLRPHTGDLLTHHHLTPQQNNQLPTLTDTLTHTLAPHLNTLTRAFNLPTTYLNAIPITTTHRPTLTNYTHP